jgi:hypothetical protein
LKIVFKNKLKQLRKKISTKEKTMIMIDLKIKQNQVQLAQLNQIKTDQHQAWFLQNEYRVV